MTAPPGPTPTRRIVPRLHVVTDDAVLARPDLLEVGRGLLVAGGSDVALHLRGPATAGRRMHELAVALLPHAHESGATLLVNDRVDIALVARAHGVHLGRRSLDVGEARRIVGPTALVGVSTHTPGEAAAATAEGADFAFAGTVYDTPTHPDRSGEGCRLVREAVSAAGPLPVFAIGGVTPERVAEVLAAGARGVAVIRGVWAAADPFEALRRYFGVLTAITEAARKAKA